ncbi:CHAT domain-containing protein [Nannocystis sp. SCPEA4]|uniref:CHAT domain-containing protein n=1 Tax=Nannocystis sp. SCPEA4 TaxID=2996787 RepID=UPI002271521D|nr:CHAT domain-containing protein [Nannocystis sp. SCPEA4]
MPTREELRAQLAEVLLACFSAGEIRRLLGHLPGGDQLAHRLPGPIASAADTSTAAVGALEALGYLERPDFWASFRRERPQRVAEIEAIRIRFVRQSDVEDGLAADGEVEPPSELVILLVSASPIKKARLRVDEEFAAIIENLRLRANLRIEQRPAVTFDRLSAALNDVRPNVLHISSHGESGSLYFQARRSGDDLQRVPQTALIKLLHALGSDLKLVVLNACDSLEIAEGIVARKPSQITWAIGMKDPIYDDDAIDYSVALYDSIAAGRAIGIAHQAALARLALNVEDDSLEPVPSEIPRLVPDDPIRAEKFLLVKRRHA